MKKKSKLDKRNRPSISVSITTFNEENYIERALKSIKGWADEIIVIDGQSSDSTVKICKKYANKVYVIPNNLNLNENKQFGLNKCSSDWIFYLDADEELSPELKIEIDNVLTNQKEYNAFKIPRKNFVKGVWLKYGGHYPDYQIRFFKRGYAKFNLHGVHSILEINGEIGVLKNDMIHFGGYRGVHNSITKINNYTTNDAKKMVEEGKKYSFIRMAAEAGYLFCLSIFKGAFLHGFYGMIYAFSEIIARYLLYIKYKEFKREKENHKLKKL